MAKLNYLDFDLLIERVGEAYIVRVLNSPAGRAKATFALPFSDLELENFFLRIGQSRTRVRGLGTSEMEAVEKFGGSLFGAVFDGAVRGCLDSSLNEAKRRDMGLRLRLNLKDAPELADLPWEYLCNPDLSRFLSLSVDTPIVRYLDLAEQIPPLEITPPLNVLVMIASPTDYPPLNVEREWTNLKDNLADLERRGLVKLERMATATLSDLQRLLRRGEYHIFHYVGHGAFDTRAQDGVLLLEDQERHGRKVRGQYLGTLLHDERKMRLVVLNSCEGARGSLTDPFAGAAQSLVQQGLPAVIAMQFEISDDAAIVFAHEFYGAIADNYPVDAALAEARKAIFAQPESNVEWGTPVLYMRSRDGVLFTIAKLAHVPPETPRVSTPPPLPPQPESVPRLYFQGRGHLRKEEWREALACFQRVVAANPDYKDVQEKLAEAEAQIQSQRQVEELYSAARELCRDELWPEVIELFAEISAIAPAYFDSEMLLASAWYGQAMMSMDAENWAAAVEQLETLHGIASDYQDTSVLLEIAREELARTVHQRKLDKLYTQAEAAERDEDWSVAIKHWEALLELQPDYRDAADRLEVARHNQKLHALYTQAREAHQAEEWAEVIALFAKIQEMAPQYPDAEGLLATAQEQQAAQRRAQELAQLYQRGMEHLEAEEWDTARQQFEKILELDANYEDAAALRQRAQEEQDKVTRQQRLAKLYAQAEDAEKQNDWDKATRHWEAIAELQPSYRDAAERLLPARRNRELATLYAHAETAEEQEDWTEAVAQWKAITELQTDYRNAAARLENAQQNRDLTALYAQAEAAEMAKDWGAAVGHWEAITRIQIDYRDATERRRAARLNHELSNLYAYAQEAEESARWDEAVRRWEAVIELRANYRDAPERLKAASHNRKLTALYAQAEAAEDSENWREAIADWKAIIELRADYRDAETRLRRAQRRQELAELYSQARTAYDAEKWAEAISIFERIEDIEPEYADIAELLVTAQEKLEACQREEELAALYQQGLEHLRAEEWDTARQQFEQIVALEPKYRKTADLLDKARRAQEKATLQQRLDNLYAQAETAEQAESWDKAARHWEAVVELQPNYRDAQDRLRTARNRQKLHNLYAQAEGAESTENWTEAVKHWEAIIEIQADYRDVPNRLETAIYYQDLASLYAQAEIAEKKGNWDEAMARWAELQEQQSDYRDASARLHSARQQRLAELYAQAETAESDDDWDRATKHWKKLVTIQADYRDAQSRLEAARCNRELSDLYAQVRAAHAAENWATVISIFEQIRTIAPNYSDSEGLLASAQENQAAAQRERELAALYQRGLVHLQAKEWKAAEDEFEQIATVDANYRKTAALLARARRELEKPNESPEERDLESLYQQALNHIRENELNAARQVLEEILEADPGYRKAGALLAKVREKRG